MDLRILFVLIIFMGLFISSGILIIKGILYKQRKALWIGIALLVICLLFMWGMKFMKGFY